MKQEEYGSINEDTLADEETALIAGKEEKEEANVVSSHPKKYGSKSIIAFLAVAAAVVALMYSGVSPFNASASAGGAAPAPFDWKAYGHDIKAFWAKKKAAWHEQKAELKAKNATKAEKKAAGKMFWNSTMPEFTDVLNTTKAAEEQTKEAEMKANQAAIEEAMAEVTAQRAKNMNN
mmetsp:Transcript_22168/g.35726  ORF Transcript_22168/g.35726 Transcript_22168/m.35726 type:complete len:177 (+) Transcript_22168:153-683(+)